MLGIHTERRKGEMHVNTRKTIKSRSRLSHLSVLRLSDVLAEEVVVVLLLWQFPGGNTPVW